jgi:hypothetical protein
LLDHLPDNGDDPVDFPSLKVHITKPPGERALKGWWGHNEKVRFYQDAELLFCSCQTNLIQSDNHAPLSISMKKYFACIHGSSAFRLWAGESFLFQLDFSNLSSHVSNWGNTSHTPKKLKNPKSSTKNDFWSSARKESFIISNESTKITAEKTRTLKKCIQYNIVCKFFLQGLGYNFIKLLSICIINETITVPISKLWGKYFGRQHSLVDQWTE